MEMSPWWGLRFCNTSLRHWDWLCPPLSLPLPMSLSLSLTAWESGTQVYGPVWWWPHLTDCFTASQPLPPTLIPSMSKQRCILLQDQCSNASPPSRWLDLPLFSPQTMQLLPTADIERVAWISVCNIFTFFLHSMFCFIVRIFLFQMLMFALFCTITCYL